MPGSYESHGFFMRQGPASIAAADSEGDITRRNHRDRANAAQKASDEAQNVRGDARTVAKARKAASERHSFLGCRRKPIFQQIISWLHYTDTFVVPAAHCLLYGVVKSHLAVVLEAGEHQLPRAARQLIEQRMRELSCPIDLGSAPRCAEQSLLMD